MIGHEPLHSQESNPHLKQDQAFQTRQSAHQTRRASQLNASLGPFAPSLTTLYAGISAVFNNARTATVAVAIHDSTYILDFSVKDIEVNNESGKDSIPEYVIEELKSYEHNNLAKSIGAGLPVSLVIRAPELCSRLWLELDIVPISIVPEMEGRGETDCKDHSFWVAKCVDEQADSMARKCILKSGTSVLALLRFYKWAIGVEVDSGQGAPILSVEDFKRTCDPPTWNAMMHYVTSLRKYGTKIAFFSSTPQGGGVALMRHALVRLAKLLGIDLTWYVPKPKPGVFRITKTIHNILQGVSEPGVVIGAEEKQILTEWIEDNAKRYWLSPGGPLRSVGEGGAHVIFVRARFGYWIDPNDQIQIDDPQMPGLIPLIKSLTPDRPVLYRSHIQIRSDLAMTPGSPQSDIWEFLWSNIRHADMFISHPIPSFVPTNVPAQKVAYLSATTDWLGGLNKDMSDWDLGYYGHLYNEQCHALRMTELRWPLKKYIVQVARFDPANHILDDFLDKRRSSVHEYQGE